MTAEDRQLLAQVHKLRDQKPAPDPVSCSHLVSSEEAPSFRAGLFTGCPGTTYDDLIYPLCIEQAVDEYIGYAASFKP
jgi:hypothetical protein